MKKSYQIIFLAALIFSTLRAFSSEPQDKKEYTLKSATLFKVCKYIDWPEEMSKVDTFRITVLGTFPNDNRINIPENETINGKYVLVNTIHTMEDIDFCHVLFIAPSEKKKLQSILKGVEGKNILTVGDSPRFSEKGVMLNFYVKDNVVKFQINVLKTNDSALKLHSQLLNIGTLINEIE